MRRYILLLLCLAAVGGARAREVWNISRGWNFFLNKEFSMDGGNGVDLPHVWDKGALRGDSEYARGIGHYVKKIAVPAEWNGKRVFIKFHGANAHTTLFVDGRYIGEHRGGSTAFVFDISGALSYGTGENTLLVMVNNSQNLGLMPTTNDMYTYGGIYRDVELIVTDRIAVSPLDDGSCGVYIRPQRVSEEKVEAKAEVKIVNPRLQSQQIQVVVTALDMDDKVVSQGVGKVRTDNSGVTTVQVPFSIDNPVLWNGVINPYVYKIGVKILDPDTRSVTDSVGVKSGFRFYNVDNSGNFFLNGRPYRIHGVVAHRDRALVGTALRSYQLQEDVDMICEMGANAVRIAGGKHNDEFYDLCDSRGIIVWSEIPFHGTGYPTDKPFVNTPEFKASGRKQLTELIKQCYNHPSICMWGLFSGLSVRGDDPTAYVRELNSLARELDPDRLTVANSNQDGDINFVTNLIVWNQSLGWISGLPEDVKVWMNQLAANWSSLKSGISYAAGASIYQQEDSLARPKVLSKWHPERWQTFFHEEYMRNTGADSSMFWGMFVGNMFDYGMVGYGMGEGNGVNDYGIVTFDRSYRKDAFYLYKANWNHSEPFVYITEKRWEHRPSCMQRVKVYSNQPVVELFVNGESRGRKYGDMGIFVWDSLTMNSGRNALEAVADSLVRVNDTAVVSLDRLSVSRAPRAPRKTTGR